jgi:hypothetical protein
MGENFLEAEVALKIIYSAKKICYTVIAVTVPRNQVVGYKTVEKVSEFTVNYNKSFMSRFLQKLGEWGW